jgi:hypothetical protein
MTETAPYLSELDAELARAGIRGSRRKRIVTEFADHLRCDSAADLGAPAALATEFADELGTSFARTAAFQAFVALALAGVAADDPYDGILRGLLEGGAFLGGYSVLGRYLGLRR